MTKPMRALALVAALVFAGNPASAGAEETQKSVTLTLAQAKQAAHQALAHGEPEVALQLANGLLSANPKDPETLLIITTAQAQLGNNKRGHKAARLAYRGAQSQPQKMNAAVWAARHALQQERPTLTQIWLRRAALHAKTEADKDRIASDYRQVRDRNPWNFRLDVGLSPSNNVNNGSDTSSLVIDGEYTGGEFNGAAQALSGVVGHLDAAVGYRLRGTQRSRTTLGARVLVQRVHLSDDARDLIAESTPPGTERVTASDFGSTYVETSLTHAFVVGQAKGNAVQLRGALGGLWYGGDFHSTNTRLDVERRWRLNEDSSFSLAGSVEHRNVDGSSRTDRTSLGLRGKYGRKLSNGDTLTLGFGVLDTRSDFINNEYRSFSLRTGYKFGRQFGPAQVSASLVLTTSDFDEYAAIFEDGGADVTRIGPRQDEAAYATLNLFFPDFDYAGFAPELSIKAGKRSSNVSRFDSSQVSISVGIQSKF